MARSDEAWTMPASWRAALKRFDSAWQTGPAPRIQAFLLPPEASAPADSSRSLLVELIKIDLEYRWKRGVVPGDALPARPRLEDYRAAFPELRVSAELIAEEYRVRRRFGDRPQRDEYLRRFALDVAQASAIFDRVDAELATEGEPAPAPARPLASADDLLAALKRSRILGATQLAEVESLRPRCADAASLARHLLECGWLTALQANFLLQGRGGDLIVGPYLLLDRLGQGWSSHVFRARHLQLGRLVALKVIRKELIGELGPQLSQRFLQEMQALGRMAHPNVILAYDAGPIGATFFLAMEYVEGIDLARVVARDGPLSVKDACAYIRQAALGLQHAHECGLVHRDLKPSNLLLESSPRPEGAAPRIKILDLGMARLHLTASGKSHSCLTIDGDLMGTPDYMSPEQAEDPHHADVRADLYSLGCTLFFLLTGRPPFPGGTFLQKVNRHRDEEPPAPETLRRDVPPALAAIVRQLLAKRREDRFQTPRELAAALAALEGRRFPRRYVVWGAAAVGVAATATTGAALAAWKLLQSRSNPQREVHGTAAAPSRIVRALEFDGVQQFIGLPDDIIDTGSVLTIETWLRTKNGGVLVGCQKGAWPKPNGGGFAPRFYVGSDGLLHGGFWHSAQGHTRLTGTRPVNDQRWHHVALVIDPKSLRMYQDGELASSVRGYIEYERLSQNQIGAGIAASDWPAGNGGSFYFEGRMREFRLWNVALSTAAIRDAMRRPLAGKERGLMLCYAMDRLDGDRLIDRSRSGNDGRLGVEPCRPKVVEDDAFQVSG
jgi:serine/threonine-protein kinase